jgi:3-keto-disaccharide hydrolase
MRMQLSLVALLSVSLAGVADDWQPELGFKSLFNGRDLTGWCFRAKADRNSSKAGEVTEKFDGKGESSDAGRYSARDGILTVNFPKGQERLISQLYTVEEFPKDFTLKLEFRASVNADSGIFIRKPQLQCRDYTVAGPYKDLKKYKPQDWNQIEIVVKGGVARCTCNGEVLESEFKLPETGPIGLEGDRGQMEYRRIQIK